MHRVLRPDGLELETSHAPGNNTVSHDHHASMSPSFSLASTPLVTPEPVYIAASAASQIVTSEYQNQQRALFEDQDGGGFRQEIALVSSASLSLVNAFLDRLLFNFLASARSTSLAALRPAVTEVLRPRLAKEAIAGADEELQEFLGGGDDEEFNAFHNSHDGPNEWDLDLIWKRTRLRCMVYTRLGDMEEEDEDMYIEQENLEDLTAPRRLSRDISIVSPPVAIFLTSILEFVGEHALMIAGEAAYKRIEHKAATEKRKSSVPQRVTVEETDMEKVALNSTLGRLWRSWRKFVRSPRSSISRVLSRESVNYRGLRGFSSSSTSRKSSVGTTDAVPFYTDREGRRSLAEALRGSHAPPEPASIPLPLTDYDVDEIEVPGYSPDAIPKASRPYSMMIASGLDSRPHVQPTLSSDPEEPSPSLDLGINSDQTVTSRHQRSQSLPTPVQTPFFTAPEYQETEISSVEALEGFSQVESPDDNKELHSVEQDAMAVPPLEAGTRSVPTDGETKPRSVSPVASPRKGLSVLNAISQHAAAQLQTPSRNPVEGERQKQDQFRPAENDKDVSTEGSRTGTIRRSSPRSIEESEDALQTRYSPSSSVQDYTQGDVSPIEPAPIESGEVSPIESDEDHHVPAVVRAYENRTLATQSKNLSQESVMSNLQPRIERLQEQQVQASTTPQVSPRSLSGRQRGTDGPTEDDYAKEEKREAFVVLEDLPLADSIRSSGTSSLSGKDLQPDGTVSNKRYGFGNEAGMLFNGPPEETTRAARGIRGETPSPGSFKADRLQQMTPDGTTSLTSSVNSLARNSPSGSKLSELRRQLPTMQTGSAIERSVIPAGPPSQSANREATVPPGRFSESNSRDTRGIVVAGVGASPASARTRTGPGLQPNENLLQPLVSRTSSDGNKSLLNEKYGSGNTPATDKQRSFEQLINSDETIQYTLTPQSMREIEGPDSPRVTSYQPQSKTSQVVNMIRSGRNSVDQNRPGTGRSNIGSVRTSNGYRASIIDTKPRSASDATVPSMGSAFVIHSGPTVKRGPQPVARDAKVDTESIRDFADFIRSTGPEQSKSKSLPKLPNGRPGSSSRTITAVHGSLRSPKSPQSGGTRTNGRTSIISSSTTNAPTSKKRISRLQPREPTANRNDESSDLIDFIRQGPPIDRSEGNHRIPRTVAPFRTTMDSDEIQALGHGRPKDAASLSTLDSSVSKSVRSSANSRTGLLDSSATINSKFAAPSGHQKPGRVEEPGAPVRKQRRVRDPYAIDSDSDGDDESTLKPQRQEESLLDFLNSVPPPQAHNDPPPINMPFKSYGKTVQRKTSGPNMRSRFGHIETSSSTANTLKKLSPQALSRGSAPSPNIRGRTNSGRVPTSTSRIRETSPHLVKQAGSKFDSFKPTQPTYASHRDRPRAAPRIQARNERDDGDDSRDLADFLKNSGPPDTGRIITPEPVKEESSFARMFSRRKKSAGVA